FERRSSNPPRRRVNEVRSDVRIDGTSPSPDTRPRSRSPSPVPVDWATFDLTGRNNPVQEIDVDHALPARDPNLTLRVNRVEPSDELGIQARRVETAAKKTIIFNDLGSTARLLTIDRSKQDQIDQAYRRLRDLVAPDADKCSFNLSKMTVRYEQGGIEHLDDL